jgi:uncharacterized protein YkwD
MRRYLLAVCLAAVGLCAAAAPAGACPGADTAPSGSSLPAVSGATLCLLNEQRAARGLPALTADTMLGDASVRFSRRMVAERFFSHVAPDGSDLVDRLRASGYLSGLSSWAVGENIAYGTGRYATARSTVQRWMASSGHRANILSSRFRAIGIGIAVGTPVSSSGATYTTDFGSAVRSPATGAPPVSPPTSEPSRPTRPRPRPRPRKRSRRKRWCRSARIRRRAARSRRARRAYKRRCGRRAGRRRRR